MTTTTAHPDKKRLILDAARRLLIEHGYQDVALDEVAKQAGVAKGTLFLYYRSKEQLLSAALADLVEQLEGSLEALSAGGRRGRALLEQTVDVILGFFERNSDFMAQVSAGRSPKLLERFSSNLLRVASVLKTCAKDGVLRGEDPELSASFLFGLCRSASCHKLITSRDIGAQQRRQKVVDFFLNGAGR